MIIHMYILLRIVHGCTMDRHAKYDACNAAAWVRTRRTGINDGHNGQD